MSRSLAPLAEKARAALAAVDNVPSPCISVCRMTPDRSVCEGCFRTLDELRAWSGASDAYKRGVWQQVMLRSGLVQPDPV